jgi:hypothetical protein
LIAPLKANFLVLYRALRIIAQVGYMAWAIKVFFDQSWIKALLKGVLASLLYMVSVGLAVTLMYVIKSLL